MGNLKFAWDRRKARSNFTKHSVTFEEAQTAFLDEGGRLIDDPDHSEMRSVSSSWVAVYKSAV